MMMVVVAVVINTMPVAPVIFRPVIVAIVRIGSVVSVRIIAVSLGIITLCSAQSDAPYTEGPVWTVSMVKTKT